MRTESIDLLWEVPLAVLSWAFYRLTRAALGILVIAYSRSRRDQPCQWELLSTETISRPLRLPIIMTSAPRWNPHAVISTVGPFRAESSIAVNEAEAGRSARAWTAVVYRFPGSHTLGSVGSHSPASSDGWIDYRVESGRYALTMRYYHPSDEAQLPAVLADGTEIAKARPIPGDLNERLYENLLARRTRFYLFLHYHVYTMLRLRHRLPRGLVERELLPVGNPETRFSYGHLPSGHALALDLPGSLLSDYDVYLTTYGRDSFPLRWEQITTQKYLSEPLDRDAFYLVRIHGRGRVSGTSTDAGLGIEVRTMRSERGGRSR